MRIPFRARRRAAELIRERLPETTYIELVQSLFGLVVPAVIMTFCFAGTGAYILSRHGDWLLIALFGLGLLASAARLAVLFGYRQLALSGTMGIHVAHAVERRFGISYIGFAALFGAFTARAYATGDGEIHILLVALAYGYGAGVAATVSLRPWISITAILIAIMPMIFAALLLPGVAHWGTGLLTALFLAGGVMSMIRRFHESAEQISLRRLMEKLAREDDLTGLPNRLVLRERFAELVARSDPTELIAIHCVDINRFDPVNEIYGHVVGDALLKAVAQRLRRVVRGDSFVVHLKDDDFVIIQPNLAGIAEAELLAHQVVATLDKSYAVAGEDIIISTNIGYAVDIQQSAELDQLLLGAERALLSSKRQASGVAVYDGYRWGIAVRRSS